MFRRPRFKPHFHVEIVSGEGVFLVSDAQQTVLQGRLYELVAACLDGRPAEKVCDELRNRASPAQIFYTLAQLEKKGYLAEADESGRPHADGLAALWTGLGLDPDAVARRLAATAVALRVVGDLDAGPFRELLESQGVRLAEQGELTVVAADGYLRNGLQECNRDALAGGRPWLLVKPVGRQVWLGPLFRPGQTGCWECLADRMRSNSPTIGYLEERNGQSGLTSVDRCRTPAMTQAGWGLAATAVTSWVAAGELPHLEGKVQTLDTLTGAVQTHSLIRQSACPACGRPPQLDRVEPLVLRPSPKVYTQDGGHRTFAPEQTLARYGHLVSPLTGAVPLLERDGAFGGPPGQDTDNGVIHVYLSGHNAARRSHSLGSVRRNLRSSNCGKGITDLQAKASALGEGLERYSGVFHGDEPRRRARLVDLAGAGLAPNDCLLFSEKQYRERDAWNAANSHDFVPLPFDPQAELEWTPVWSLTRQEPRWLPTAYCYFGYPQEEDQAFCESCSNGNAAGNTLEEAILQGFFELVERDSVALWWYNRVRRPGVDLDSFGEPYLDDLRAFLGRHHRELWVLDLTSDLEVPVFAAASRRTDGGAEQILFGFGAHLDARVALLRAITEMNQMLARALTENTDAPPERQLEDRVTLDWLRTATVANQPYLQPLDGPPRTAAGYPPCRTADLKDDIVLCQKLVERHGMEMLVLDQTRPEIGLPVAKVIVPGLRHFWPRFGPGRLYDVPVRLGRLRQPLAEEQFNPVPMFL
jgi:bacteriocin biosynthesis cyclodehydratase domain-containing protein